MALSDLIAADNANVILNEDDFAESVTLLRSDDSMEAVTAIVMLYGEEWNEFDKQWEQRGTVEVASTVGCERDDKWILRGKTFKVEKYHDAESGMQQMEVIAIRKTGARP